MGTRSGMRITNTSWRPLSTHCGRKIPSCLNCNQYLSKTSIDADVRQNVRFSTHCGRSAVAGTGLISQQC